jgi:hypothetical protein
MSFDPTTFLNQTLDQANDTKITPCPVGEYLAIAEKVDVKPWSSKDGSSSGLKVNILWEIQDENVKALLDRDKILVPQDIMLDLNESGEGLDMGKGKNVGLGRLREALDLNKPGEPFSFSMIQGRPATVAVSHRTGQNPEDIFHEIKRVAKVA